MKTARAIASLLLLATLPAASFIPSDVMGQTLDRNLTPRTRGEDVAVLQQFLIASDKLKIESPTGYYGPLTTSAVADWQRENGITPTGNAGPITRSVLNSGVLAQTVSGGGGTSGGSGPRVSPPAPSESVVVTVPTGFVQALSQLLGTSTPALGTSTLSVASTSLSLSTAPAALAASPSGSPSRRRTSPPRTAQAIPYGSVSSTSPVEGASGVYRDRGIQIVFAGLMDPGTINSTTITVSQNGSPVSGTVSYSQVGNTAVFVPSSDFAANAEIEVVVSDSIKTSTGFGLATDYVFWFNTGSGFSSDTAIDLGTASSYGILAYGLANTGSLTVTGSLGTGAGGQAAPATVSGSNDKDNAAYQTANSDLNKAIVESDSRVCDTVTSGSASIGGQTFTPGVYCFTGPVTMAGTTTLDGSGTFLFRFSDSFTASSTALVEVVNGAHPNRAYWMASGSATVASGAKLLGNLVGLGDVVVASGGNVDGRVFSRGTVTTGGSNAIAAPSAVYCSNVPLLGRKVAYIATSGTVTGTHTGCEYAIYVRPASTVTIDSADVSHTTRGGIYIGAGATTTITNTAVHDTWFAGIYNGAAHVNISSSTVYNIGDRDENDQYRLAGTQQGFGIVGLVGSTGSIIGNQVYNYQKGGIFMLPIDNLFIRDNVISGAGSTTITAQIGLQIGQGGTSVLTLANAANITGNVISGNVYTPTIGASTGFLGNKVVGQDGAAITAAIKATNTITGYGNPTADEDIVVETF